MAKVLKVVPIGNSKGIRIPSAMLRRQGIEEEIECVETIDGILLRPKKAKGLSFKEAFIQMGKDKEALAEAREFEGTLGDGLEQDDYS